GRPFEEEAFANAENEVQRALADRGYAHATVARDAVVDVVHETADIVLRATPGPHAVLGKVTIEGLGNLPEAPVRRAPDLAEGSEYSASELDSARQAVLDLGVFSSVDIIPDLTGSQGGPGVVPVHVRTERAKLHSVRIGVGVEFDPIKTDVHGLIGWEDRNFL